MHKLGPGPQASSQLIQVTDPELSDVNVERCDGKRKDTEA